MESEDAFGMFLKVEMRSEVQVLNCIRVGYLVPGREIKTMDNCLDGHI